MSRSSNLLTRAPFYLLLLSGLISVFVILLSGSSTMDLHYADTYLVVKGYIFPTIALILSIIIWLCCINLDAYLTNRTLSWIHVTLSFLFLVLIALSPLLYDFFYAGAGFAGTPRRYYNYWTIDRYNNSLYFGELVAVAFFLVITSQFLLILNAVKGQLKRP